MAQLQARPSTLDFPINIKTEGVLPLEFTDPAPGHLHDLIENLRKGV